MIAYGLRVVILDKESHWHGFLLRTPASLSAVYTILYAHLYLSMTLGYGHSVNEEGFIGG